MKQFTQMDLKEFLISHYKHERLYGRGEEYVDAVINGRIESLTNFGSDCISRHESNTSEAVFFQVEWAKV